MFDPERAARQLNSYQDMLKSNPDAREITEGMPLIRDQRNALLQEIVQQGFFAIVQDGKWHVRKEEGGDG